MIGAISALSIQYSTLFATREFGSDNLSDRVGEGRLRDLVSCGVRETFMMTQPSSETTAAIADALQKRVINAAVFADVSYEDGRLSCEAKYSAEPATYRVDFAPDGVWISLVMEDRWQSESIEADLMHSGDKLEELLEEELVDQGYDGATLPFEHFRSDDMLFTFRSKAPANAIAGDAKKAAEVLSQCLLAYEACFAELGDMSADAPE